MVERVAAHLLEHRRPLQHLHLGLDADFLEHGLDGLGDLAVLGIAAARGEPGQRQALAALLHDAVGARRPAGLGEQRLGLGAIERIGLVELHVLVAEHAGREHAQRRTRRALHDVVEDGLPVHRVQQRLAHPHVVQRRQARVQPREDHADPGGLVHGELRVAAERGQLRRRGEEHHVRVAGLQRDHPGAFFRHHLEDHAIEERLVAPVVREALDDHVGVGLPLHELERPRAHRRPAEVGAQLAHRGGRHDAHAVHGQRAEHRAIGLPGDDVHGEVVHHLGPAQRAGEARPARGRGALERAVIGELHRGGVHRRAVVELHPGPELEAHPRGRHDLVGDGQRRLHLHLRVQGEEPLQHVEVHPRPGGGGLEIRLQRDGIGGAHDGEGAAPLLGLGGVRGGQKSRGDGAGEQREQRVPESRHRISPCGTRAPSSAASSDATSRA